MTAPRPATPVALYVHVPFCLSVCPYCDFVVYGGRAARGPESLVRRFVDAASAETELRGAAAADRFGDPRPPLGSVYLGGGTPSLLPPADVARLLEAADRAFGLAADAEVTLEVNPGPSERGDMSGFFAAGVNRLSIGAQSMSADELRSLGRRHGPADVADTFALARSAGFASLSIDLLYDVPGQTLASWRRSLEAVLSLAPDHVSAYGLTLETAPDDAPDRVPSREGALRWRRRAARHQDEDRAAASYRLADRLLAGAGLRWYEISNWARPGFESRHNLCYWQGLSFEAVGPGAHAFDGARTRRWNSARLDDYLAALVPPDGSMPRLPPGGAETADPAVADADRAILRLRTRSGVPAPALNSPSGREFVDWGLAHRLLETSSGTIRLTRRGRLLSNELFLRLAPPTVPTVPGPLERSA